MFSLVLNFFSIFRYFKRFIHSLKKCLLLICRNINIFTKICVSYSIQPARTLLDNKYYMDNRFRWDTSFLYSASCIMDCWVFTLFANGAFYIRLLPCHVNVILSWPLTCFLSLQVVYDNILKMRKERNAPVDSMGCERAHDMQATPTQQRFQCLVSLMLSSMTKVTFPVDIFRRLQ